jgi:hypothetical protein
MQAQHTDFTDFVHFYNSQQTAPIAGPAVQQLVMSAAATQQPAPGAGNFCDTISNLLNVGEYTAEPTDEPAPLRFVWDRERSAPQTLNNLPNTFTPGFVYSVLLPSSRRLRCHSGHHLGQVTHSHNTQQVGTQV